MEMFSCSNDVINHFDCVIKRDVYQQKKLHSSSKNIRFILFLFHKIFVVYLKKYNISHISFR